MLSGAWAPATTSRRANRRFLRPQGGWCLFVAGSPRACLIGGLGLAPGRGERRDGRTVGEIMSVHAYHRAEK
jgi:hypothetical protein